MQYLRVTETSKLPDFSALRPFKVVLIGEDRLSPERQELISDWLVESGCLYAMAWGEACDEWFACIQHANRKPHDTELIPDKSLIITTLHADEPLPDVFWFAKYTAMHPCHALEHVVLLHIASQADQQDIPDIYESV